MFNQTVTVAERPAIKTAGVKTRTTLANAKVDCPKLWNDFCPHMAAFPADTTRPGESYGLSIMLDSERFDYWAVMPIANGAATPGGMHTITIPAGHYAECVLESLADLGAAYTYIYGPWSETNGNHHISMQGICYELYTQDYIKNGSLTIYCPLL